MSYWNRLEPKRGQFDWRELDWQIDMAESHGAEVTLCLGLRQPRWPESHWPDWAKQLPDKEWQADLHNFIKKVVERYKNRSLIVSYQLENEAMLKTFGRHGNFDRDRLKSEFDLVKSLDNTRPIIMSTSDSWGIPVFGPRPDLYAFSIYRYFYDKGSYRHASRPALFYEIRAMIVRLLKRRWTFIHELQAEPWGPKPIPEMSLDEQFRSMNLDKVKQAVKFANKTNLHPIDIWGLEWWYWLKTRHKHAEIWYHMQRIYSQI